MNSTDRSFLRLASLAVLTASLAIVRAQAGADVPWTTYEAEDMKTTGQVLGPGYEPNHVETEASGQKCVELGGVGQYVEFKAQSDANAIVVRYSLPDAEKGGGIDSTLGLYQNGRLVQQLPVTSRYSWLYGKYPFSNDPKDGDPRNFYDEVRLKDLSIHAGDTLRIQEDDASAPYCIVDLVDLEQVAPPLAAPGNSLSVTDFGAVGDGKTDATEALRKCVEAARTQGKAVWVPAGNFLITGDIDLSTHVTIQGAGMWHTTFVGDPAVYAQSNRRVRFNGRGSDIHLADFAILGKLNFRNDGESNDGLTDTFGENSTVTRLWIEHTKTGMWFNNSSNLVVDSCRLRDTVADGINFCVGVRGSTMVNCTARGTGDDCFAIWPAIYMPQTYKPGRNVIRHCTGQSPFLANGGAIYGGEGNHIEDCTFKDILSGCAILLSTTFPTDSDEVNNNFTGTTVIRDCELDRSGGFDPWRTWRAAFQICMDNKNIRGLDITNVTIKDSISDAFSVVASEGQHGNGTLRKATIEKLNIPNYGIGVPSRHGFWIRKDAYGSLTLSDSTIVEQQNDSTNFIIK